MDASDTPYKSASLPSDVVASRRRSAAYEEALGRAIAPELETAVGTARNALAELTRHHQRVVEVTDLDLHRDAGGQHLALWEAAAAALGLANAYVDLIALGYHAQTLPTYRALHEVLGVVSALNAAEEPEFLSSWLNNDEVRPRDVRAIASRTAARLRVRIEGAGLQGPASDPADFMRQLYGPLSDSSHGRREAVRDYVSESLRLGLTGSHPAASIRIHFVELCLQLTLEVVLVAGLALWTLYGGSFYADRVGPIQAGLERATEALAILRSHIPDE